jgi:hypothetical protein
MDTLRRHTRLAQLVLAWFMVAIGVSVAAPLVRPVVWQAVCSAAGSVQWVVQDANDQAPAHSPTHVPAHTHGLNCPLCLSWSAPPPLLADWPAHRPLLTAQVVSPPHAAPLAQQSAPPLPSRGPPSVLAVV